MRRTELLAIVLWAITAAKPAIAETISVRHLQQPMHRFMIARSERGETIANGEFLQAVQGNEVTMRMTYRFLDGSVDDETTTYRQQGTFRLVRNHHIQRGPFFSRPVDSEVEVATSMVTNRTTDKNGAIHVESKHMDLPDDLSNGFIGTLLLNVSHNTAPFRVPMLVPVGGGRLVRLLISPVDEQTVQLGGKELKATVFRIHPDLGGVLKMFARLLGLQPKDVTVWVLEGDEPAVAVIVGQLGGYGPVVSSDLVETGSGK